MGWGIRTAIRDAIREKTNDVEDRANNVRGESSVNKAYGPRLSCMVGGIHPSATTRVVFLTGLPPMAGTSIRGTMISDAKSTPMCWFA